jgi:hypothetical protein
MVLVWLINGFLALFVISALGYMFRQGRRDRKARRTTRELRISPMSGLAMGAMLLGFQAIVHPQVRNMIVEEQRKEAFKDEGDNDLIGMLFRHDLQRIRRGEDIDHLTVRVGP